MSDGWPLISLMNWLDEQQTAGLVSKVNGPVSGRLTSSGTPPGKSAKSQNFARKKPLGGVRTKKNNTKPAFGPKKEIQTLKQQGKGRLTAVGPGDQNGKNTIK